VIRVEPRMMEALLLHGYSSWLYSSRRIARACRKRNAFCDDRILTGANW
jgi:hypothetical protein